MSPRRERRRPPAPVVPAPLRRGDTVAVLAPGFPARDERALWRGIRRLEAWGLRARLGDSVARRWGYFAATDPERARDLQAAINDPGVRGILFARGGWGTSRILERVDLSALRSDPKVVIGYSDLTVLFTELWGVCGLVCGYGPVVSELGLPSAFHARSLRRALFRPGAPLALKVPRDSILSAGTRARSYGGRRSQPAGIAEGRLLGGCLTLLAHLCGSGRLPDFRGSVLFVEEVQEEPYRVDRMLCQLRMAGVLKGVAAVLVGSMTRCAPRRGMTSFSIREVLADHLGKLDVPVLLDIPAGHGPGKWTLPLGFTARVDAGAGRVTLSP